MRKRTKSDSVLVNVAESIGSTLGTLAAKADAAQRALTKVDITDIGSTIEREGKKLILTAREAVAGTSKNATRAVARRKRSGTTRTSGRKGKASRKGKSARVAPRGIVKRAKPRRRMKKVRRINPR